MMTIMKEVLRTREVGIMVKKRMRIMEVKAAWEDEAVTAAGMMMKIAACLRGQAVVVMARTNRISTTQAATMAGTAETAVARSMAKAVVSTVGRVPVIIRGEVSEACGVKAEEETAEWVLPMA
jgi:hypothetical protein